ncbi:hypothetical protein [Geodermatophilus saharensis]|uniref:hypothetical protein n=1 Tax=Geodermatophilus saharensis TaxID=1137994 RepID=UPI00159587FE|nr:hypothetical protein [Geodermatophilus saharensis]
MRSADGTLLGRADFAWEAGRLLGEFDGRVEYGRLLRPSSALADRVRRALRLRRRPGA